MTSTLKRRWFSEILLRLRYSSIPPMSITTPEAVLRMLAIAEQACADHPKKRFTLGSRLVGDGPGQNWSL